MVDIHNLPFGLGYNISILPKQRFILDRTECNPYISYPGEICSGDQGSRVCLYRVGGGGARFLD